MPPCCYVVGVQEILVSGIPGLKSETWGTLCGFPLSFGCEGKMERFSNEIAPLLHSFKTDARMLSPEHRRSQIEKPAKASPASPGGLLVNAGNHLRSHTLTRAVPSPAGRGRRPHASLPSVFLEWRSLQNRKARQGFPGGLLVNAGNHLRSHTLTRAVPSAQRGLTSVFGMGTGVTLAVYSPANLGVLQDLFPSCVCSDNLNRAVKTHLRAFGALGGGSPPQSLRVQASFPEVLARQTGAIQPDFSQRNRLG